MAKIKNQKSNHEEAMKTIDRNINKIYIDGVIDIVITEIRHRIKINKDMYQIIKNESRELDKIKKIDKLIEFLKKEWVKRSFKNEIERKILVKHIAKEEATREHTNTSINEATINQLAEMVSESDTEKYLMRQIETYPLSDSFTIFPTRINLKIWKSIIDAKLFNVPIKKVLDCRMSILENYYLPSVETSNGDIYIKINEITSLGDIALIWDTKIKKAKKDYKEKYKYENSERACKDNKLDSIILELYNQGLKPKAISNKLHNGYVISLDSDKVTYKLKEIRKRSRNSLKKKLLLEYSG